MCRCRLRPNVDCRRSRFGSRSSESWRSICGVYSADGQHPVLAATALAAVASMLTAGLFEYNFGDSEFLMLFLVLVTLPFAAVRPSTADPTT